ncbi:hypothetical protein T02_3091, partial [Trichinella nativa]
MKSMKNSGHHFADSLVLRTSKLVAFGDNADHNQIVDSRCLKMHFESRMLILTVSKKKVLANAGSVVLVGVLRGCCLSREGRLVRHWACWHHSEADAAERTQHAYQRKQLRC